MEDVRCKFCEKFFDDPTTLSVHQQFDSCVERIRCPLCDEAFDNSHLVEIHFNEVHDRPTNDVDPFAQQLAERQKRLKKNYENEKNDENIEDEDAMIARLLQEEEDVQSFQDFQVEISRRIDKKTLR